MENGENRFIKMKKILWILLLGFFVNSKAYGEVVKIDCTLYFDGQPATAYYELNSKSSGWWAEFIGDKIFWTSITEQEGGKWRPLYHSVDRRTGVYVVDFGVVINKRPEKDDDRVKIWTTNTGTCKPATSKKLF